LAPQPVPLNEGPVVFTVVAEGRADGKKFVLTVK
jgi:hypothetical protein